jgi:hypothetical protein
VTIAAELAAEALSVGLLLSRHGEHIHVDSPLGQPLPSDLRERLAAHREDVLAWLDWCVSADALLLATSRRIATRLPMGCPLDDDQWSAAEEALAEAHRSQDPGVLREALARYERFALAKFSAYERGVR